MTFIKDYWLVTFWFVVFTVGFTFIVPWFVAPVLAAACFAFAVGMCFIAAS